MKLDVSKEWCMKMAEREGDAEVGAGLLARDPSMEDLAMHKEVVQSTAYNDAKQHLLSAINLMATDGIDQRLAVEMLRRMEQANRSPDDIIYALAGYLRDLVSQ